MPAIRKAIGQIKRRSGVTDRDGLRQLVERLWAKPVFELRLAAVFLLEAYQALLLPADFGILERLIVASKTWALVDVLAIAVVGPLVERNPSLRLALDAWSTDPDFWLRRAALLALLGPLRRGAGDFDRFSRYADAMLEDREFFIRKAIGWVLRETSKGRPRPVYEWLLPRATRASGITVGEAVKYLSPRQRDAVLASYRSARPPARVSGPAPR